LVTTPLPLITALARAGALDQAWRLFRDGGYDAQDDSPAALAVKGRLLKDDGLRAAGEARRDQFRLAAAAYAAADAIAPQPYLLINVATLSFLSGDGTAATIAARHVIDRLEAPGAIAETPYWLAATRAEALLLLDDEAGAGAALTKARAADPDGWADHAATLRQLGLICTAQGRETAWLDAHRPPQSLYFAGHLGIAHDDHHALRVEIDTLLAQETIGFGYGALAAGADIIVAEALIARGAELHIILPTACDVFIAQSITPYGGNWRARFDTLIAAATSVQEATAATGDYEPRATALAADMAMGGALLNARQIESRAVQLLVIDDGPGRYGAGSSTARDGEAWVRAGHRQHIVRWPRSARVTASRGKTEGRQDRSLMAMLMVSFSGVDRLGEGGFAAWLDTVAAPFWAASHILAIQPRWAQPHGNARILGFDSVADATAFAQALRATNHADTVDLVIAGHYGLVHCVENGMMGTAISVLIDAAAFALPGAITVSAAFATALALTRGDVRTEHIGESGTTPLFALQ
jgi:hypothetical protein